jgi:hypothetical protein
VRDVAILDGTVYQRFKEKNKREVIRKMSLADIIFREAPWIEEERQGRAGE